MSDTPLIKAKFTGAGALAELTADDLALILYPATDLEAGPQQVWLRRRDGGITPRPLTGPASQSSVRMGTHGPVLSGRLDDLAWTLAWVQPDGGLFGWLLSVRNDGDAAVELDAVHLFDAALTPRDDIERNEYYVSQYLDVQPLGDGADFMIAVRQNMPGGTNPWLALTSSDGVAGWCTDALQLASDHPGGGLNLGKDLPGERLQHEHTLIGLQTPAFTLEPGESHEIAFRGVVVKAHPEASAADDARFVQERIEAAEWGADEPSTESRDVVPTLFSPVSWVIGETLSDDDFVGLSDEATAIERDESGQAWAYWTGETHYVSSRKEREVLRPHGHVLQAAAGLGPQAITTASTAWMSGTFASQVIRGHAHIDPLVSVRRSYLGLLLAEGLRIFIRDEGAWELLGAPSAWSVDFDAATWWYRIGERMITIHTELSLGALDLRVNVEGPAMDILVFARGHGVEDAPLFSDGVSRGLGDARVFERVTTAKYRVDLAPETEESTRISAPELISDDEGAARLSRALPWFVANARIHYQTPRGLEQFTGGAWGTRDVCQGPVGLLLATNNLQELREVILAVFAGQQDNGDWPQWFNYLEAHTGPGHRDSHGDVVYWPLIALADYLEATGDTSIFDETAVWVGECELAPESSILEHVKAAIKHLQSQRSADPRLPAYGHGDWNDSLQPSSPELARIMTSTWTAGLEVKALEAISESLATVDTTLSAETSRMAEETRAAISELLLVDDELCGYAIIGEDGVEPLVHPRDTRTGLHHGSLQMIHAIGDELLTPEEAARHLEIINTELDGPVGIYLFDRPVTYHGGETHTFLRAEAASFWGREIGLMYMHAHIRWVEALLKLGEADRAWEALQKVLPEGQRALVPSMLPLQSNCYYSSVDATFRDRYEARDKAEELFDPQRGFVGGWRVYSSGPGLVLRLVVEGFLGLKWTKDGLIVDPVLPVALDGLIASLRVGGRDVRVTYNVSGPELSEVSLGGRRVDGLSVARRYRSGGILVPAEQWADGASDLVITLS